MLFTIIITIACYTFLLANIGLITRITRNSIASSINKSVENRGLTKVALDKICKLSIITSKMRSNSIYSRVFSDVPKITIQPKNDINKTYFMDNLYVEFSPFISSDILHLEVVDIEQQEVFNLIVMLSSYNEKDYNIKIYKPNFKCYSSGKGKYSKGGPCMAYEEINITNLIYEKELKDFQVKIS